MRTSTILRLSCTNGSFIISFLILLHFFSVKMIVQHIFPHMVHGITQSHLQNYNRFNFVIKPSVLFKLLHILLCRNWSDHLKDIDLQNVFLIFYISNESFYVIGIILYCLFISKLFSPFRVKTLVNIPSM